jgi:uncharacterized membrane protein
MNKKALVFIVIALCFIVGFYSYYLMPEQMASHWNEYGQVNGYVSRSFGVFFFPILLLVLSLFLIYIPNLDPLKKNIEKFRDEYEMFVVWFTVFFFYVYVLTLLWNLGVVFNMNIVLMPAMGLLFFFMGSLLNKAKRNYFIGIRTPWTLASDKVWDKTHKLGAKLFKAMGLITISSVFFSDYAFMFVFFPIIFFTLYLVIYSYYEFKKENE